MTRWRFTAREVVCIAVLCGKEKLYGIPDPFASIPQEKRFSAMQSTMNDLLDEQILEMNFAGAVSVREESFWLSEFVCNCESCMTVTLRSSALGEQNSILWKKGDKLLMAEAEEGQYQFSFADASFVRSLVRSISFGCAAAVPLQETVIPRVALRRAKRFFSKGRTEDALRLLRQNGAGGSAVSAVADGITGELRYTLVRLVEVCGKEHTQREVSYLSGKNIVLALEEQWLNLTACVKFISVDSAEPASILAAWTEDFLQRETKG